MLLLLLLLKMMMMMCVYRNVIRFILMMCRLTIMDKTSGQSSSSYLLTIATMSIIKNIFKIYSCTIRGLPEKLYCSLTGRPNKNKKGCSTKIL